MRVTITLDDDFHYFAKTLANKLKLTLSDVVSELAYFGWQSRQNLPLHSSLISVEQIREHQLALQGN